MKRFVCAFIIIMIIVSSVSFASYSGPIDSSSRVFQLGLLGRGGLDLDRNINRDELATIAVRIGGFEYLAAFENEESAFTDVDDWATAYVNIASDKGYVRGISKDKFNPKGKVNYTELLTVLMRLLAYEDGIDFNAYPDEYYNKAIEIGLGNLYISYDHVVNRGLVAETIDKALDLEIKGAGGTLASSLGKAPIVEVEAPKDKPYMDNLSFNTSIIGVFSGTLKGISSSGYKLVFLSGADTALDRVILDKFGAFSIEGFDIGVVAKLQGYKYEVYSPQGDLVLKEELK